MKIVETKGSLTIDDIAKIEEQRKELEKTQKQEERKNLLGNLKKPTRTNPSDRFYLPVLHINDATQWESQPMENRIHFTDEIAYNTCVGNCCGVKGLKAACCHLDPDDLEHVLGPVDEEWITDFVKWLRKRGIAATRHDVVIDYEEGKLIGERFFKGHPIFSKEDSYPILRIQAVGPRFACKFLNFENGKCTIYEQRPKMCRGYLCNYIKANFLVRTKDHPNTYQKLR